MILLVILITASQFTIAQKLEPILAHNNLATGHTLEQLRDLAFDTINTKSIQFHDYVVEKITECLKDSFPFTADDLDQALQDKYMSCEKMTLDSGTYENSGWNPTTQKIEFFLGKKDLTTYVWVFRLGTHRAVICKSNCANILNILGAIKKPVQPVQPAKKADTTTVKTEEPKKKDSTTAVFIRPVQSQQKTQVKTQVKATLGNRTLTTQSGAVNNDLPNNNQKVANNNNGNGNTSLHAASGAINSVYGPNGGGQQRTTYAYPAPYAYGGQKVVIVVHKYRCNCKH